MKSLLFIIFLFPTLESAAQSRHKISFDFFLDCEEGRNNCVVDTIFRIHKNDELQIEFPVGGTETDVALYSDTEWKKVTKQKPAVEVKSIKYSADDYDENPDIAVMKLNSIPDGKYFAHLLGCGLGGVVIIYIKTKK